MKSQIVTSTSPHGGRRTLPYAFTEQGVAMLSAVLKSNIAIETSIQIIQTFVEMRRFIQDNQQLFQRIDLVENRLISHAKKTDKKFVEVFKALNKQETLPKQGIFYDGEFFDTYPFVTSLIRGANKSIILIDNFIDETILTMLSKRKKPVSATIYTKQMTKQTELDLKKHNKQYPEISVIIFKESHDRFLIIDEDKLYHFGASLKDLGNKWFAFSRMDSLTNDVLEKLHIGNKKSERYV